MINTASIVLSLIAVGIIVIRAVMLDRTLPWFKPVPAAKIAAKGRSLS